MCDGFDFFGNFDCAAVFLYLDSLGIKGKRRERHASGVFFMVRLISIVRLRLPSLSDERSALHKGK